jgi:hypothetical protein
MGAPVCQPASAASRNLPIAAWAARKPARTQALAWLAEAYPAVFGANVVPLMLGVGRLVWPEAKAAGIKHKAFNAALKKRTNSFGYLDALAAGGATEKKIELTLRTQARVRAISQGE